MPKPRLPPEIEKLFPSEILHKIYAFLPPIPTPKPSPSLQIQVEKLQKGNKKTAMYLKGLDDFVLDKQ